MKKFQKKNKILFSFIIAFIMLVSTGIVLLINDNNNKIVKAVYNNQFNATWQSYYFNGNNQLTYGKYVWSNGTNYYYDYSSYHFIFNTSTNSWETMTWNGFTGITASNVWSDGTNYYYSGSSNQYIFDFTTSTLTAKVWNGLTSFSGNNVWSDGTNYYYTVSGYSYILDTSTSTWSTVNLGTAIRGEYVWSDGVDTYYTYNGTTKKFDTSTSTWSNVTFTGDGSIYNGTCIWHLDYNNTSYVVYTYEGSSYFVDTSTYTLTDFDINFDNNISGNGVNGADIFYLNGYYFAGYVQVGSQPGTLKLVLSNSSSGGDSTPDAFDGSNVYVPFVPIWYGSNGNTYNGGNIYYLDLQMNFGINQNDDYYITFVSNYLNNYISSGVISQSQVDITHMLDNTKQTLSDFTFTDNDIGSSINFYLYDNIQYDDIYSALNIYNTRLISVTVTISSAFTDFSFIGCHLFSEYTQDNNMYSIYNHVRYFDADNGFIDIAIYSYTNISSAVDMYSSRMYYFESALSNGSSYGDYISGYNQGYDEGYSDGLNSGNSQGYDEGYAEGYQDGVDDTYDNAYNTQYWLGYNTGYSDGVESSSPYTFSALIGAVIDTPIKYMTSLFNFNLLGINLLNFLLALLTLGVIVILIKKIL